MTKNLLPKIILGIDPGYDRVGWAVGSYQNSKFHLLNLGCIQTDSNQNIFDRYTVIILNLKKIIKRYKPEVLAIETLFFSKNKKTALRVSESRGIIVGTLLNSGVNVYEYSPNSIKLAVTGSGSANKHAVEKLVKMQVDHKMLGQINAEIDDAIDAVAVAMTHVFTKTF
ncbi:MAG: crossover junction endodeoxyribonuclease RuvC [Pseudomonadales bacterium]|nr:crossover junction endodeoxyribonuclease RuvC [Pseudomonadales bacterium]